MIDQIRQAFETQDLSYFRILVKLLSLPKSYEEWLTFTYKKMSFSDFGYDELVKFIMKETIVENLEEFFKFIISEIYLDPFDITIGVKEAIRTNNFTFFQTLFNLIEYDSDFLDCAVYYNRLDMTEYILDQDIPFNKAFILEIAISTESTEMVRFLLKKIEIDESEGIFALEIACGRKNLDIVKMLLHYPPCLQYAFFSGINNINIIELLLSDPRVDTFQIKEQCLIKCYTYQQKMAEMILADRKKYPTYKIRQHNLLRDQKIQALEKEIDTYFSIISDFNNRKGFLEFYRVGLELQIQILTFKIQSLKSELMVVGV